MLTTATILFHSQSEKELNLLDPTSTKGTGTTLLFSGSKESGDKISDADEYLQYLKKYKLKLFKAVFFYESARRQLKTEDLRQKQIYVDGVCVVRKRDAYTSFPIYNFFTSFQNVADQVDVPFFDEHIEMDTDTDFIIRPNVGEYGKVMLFFTDKEAEKSHPGLPVTTINLVEKSGTGAGFIQHPPATSKIEPNA